METHAQLGAAILSGSKSPLLRQCETISRSHHEKWDGSGYPNGLQGDAIPLVGRIVAVADVFDAICSKRVYKDAVPLEDVLPIIRKEAGSHFDPRCVDAFFESLDEVRAIHLELKD